MSVHEQAEEMTYQRYLAKQAIDDKFKDIHKKLLEEAKAAGFPDDIEGYIKFKKSEQNKSSTPTDTSEPSQQVNHWSYVANGYRPSSKWPKKK